MSSCIQRADYILSNQKLVLQCAIASVQLYGIRNTFYSPEKLESKIVQSQVIEYVKLEGTLEDHRVQLSAPSQDYLKLNYMIKNIVQLIL